MTPKPDWRKELPAVVQDCALDIIETHGQIVASVHLLKSFISKVEAETRQDEAEKCNEHLSQVPQQERESTLAEVLRWVEYNHEFPIPRPYEVAMIMTYLQSHPRPITR